MRYAIDSSKIKNKLRWRPKVSFMIGLKKHLIGTKIIKNTIQI